MGDAAIQLVDLRYRHQGAQYDGYLLQVEGKVEFRGPGLTALSGRSGSGKTTLLEILMGDRSGYEGSVVVDGVRIDSLHTAADVQRLRRRVGVIFQDNRLFDSRTVRENVQLVLDDLDLAGAAESEGRIREVLGLVGLAGKIDDRAGVLSCGEKRRVMIAKVLVRDARVILADEPTAGVEEELVQGIFDLLQRLSGDRSVVLVTHEEWLARRCPARYDLDAGRLLARSAGVLVPVATVRDPRGAGADHRWMQEVTVTSARHPGTSVEVPPWW